MPLPPTSHALSLDKALQNALDGVFVVDRERRVLLFNAGCERITGYPASEIVGRQCVEFMNCHDAQGRPLWGALCPTRALYDGSTDSLRQRMQIRRGDGADVWVETIYTPVRDRMGTVECILGVVRDISESKEREDDLRAEISHLRDRPAAPAAAAPDGSGEFQLDARLAQLEREVILKALRAARWHRNKAAELMKISRSRLYRRMEALGIRPGEPE